MTLLDINDMELRNIVRVIKLSYIILESAASLVRHITVNGGEIQENMQKNKPLILATYLDKAQPLSAGINP